MTTAAATTTPGLLMLLMLRVYLMGKDNNSPGSVTLGVFKMTFYNLRQNSKKYH